MKKLENYKELKKRHEKETNSLPIYFAYGQQQINELIKKLGFESEEELIKNVFTIGGGSIVLKSDKEKVLNTFKRHNKELKENLQDNDFMQNAFEYRLANHEYIITYELEPTLYALRITLEEYYNDSRMQNCMKLAIANYKKDMEKLGW